ncbi:MAG: radical SAM protein, partial [Planctomycetota bacterium]
MSKPNIAFLVFKGSYKKQKRKRSDFDGQDNIGAYIIIDVLERAGYTINFCAPETASRYDIVLASFTSLYDVFNFLEEVAGLSSWKKENRTFTSIVGGAGVQNVAPYREYIDYAVFGRAENFVVDMIKTVSNKKDFQHTAVMPLRYGITPVWYEQVDAVYPHEIKVGTGTFKEKVSGCPLKCAFCHYTYARKWIGGGAQNYVLDGGVYQGSAEGLFKDSATTIGSGHARIISGLDGFSQRLRYAMRKRISNEKMHEVFQNAAKNAPGKSANYKLYMIGSYPTETEEDFQEFLSTMRSVEIEGPNKCYVIVHLTPFQASPLSPAEWLPVDFSKNWRD